MVQCKYGHGIVMSILFYSLNQIYYHKIHMNNKINLYREIVFISWPFVMLVGMVTAFFSPYILWHSSLYILTGILVILANHAMMEWQLKRLFVRMHLKHDTEAMGDRCDSGYSRLITYVVFFIGYGIEKYFHDFLHGLIFAM